MKKQITLFFLTFLIVQSWSIAQTGELLKIGTDFSIWYENPMEKVYPNIPVPTKNSNKIRIKAARSEKETFQLVLTANRNMSNVTFEFSNLTGSSTILSSNFELMRATFVNITEQSAKAKGVKAYYLGWIPDALPVVNSSNINIEQNEQGNNNNPYWIRLQIPESALAGNYAGKISVKENGTLLAEIDISVGVWDFSIQNKDFLFYMNTWNKKTKLNDSGMQEFLSENFGSNKTTVRPPVTINKNSGVVTLGNLSSFDNYISELVNDYQMNVIQFPLTKFFGKDHGVNLDAIWEGIKVWNGTELNPVFVAAYGSFNKQMASHFREKGWLDKFWIYNIDEVNSDTHLEYAIKIFKVIHDADPDIRIGWVGGFGIDIENSQELPLDLKQLDEYVSDWVLHDEYWKKSFTDKQNAAGDRVWCYNNSRFLIDRHAMRYRTYGWSIFNRNLKGELRWSINFNETWEASDEGMPGRWGCGYITYPPRTNVEKPAVTSIRLENMRESIEDYTYLQLLESLIKTEKEKGTDVSMAESVFASRLNIASETTPSKVHTPNNEPYSLESAELMQLRDSIAKYIVKLSGGIPIPISEELISLEGPVRVVPKSTVTINVGYAVSSSYDLVLQIKNMAGNKSYGYTKTTLNKGTGVAEISLKIDSLITPMEAGYKYIAFLTPIGENWNARKDDIFQNAVSCNFSSKKKDEILIYPNPASSKINIDWGKHEAKSILLLNILGKVLIKYPIGNAIDINNLSEGIYFLVLESNDHVEVKKLIKGNF